MIRVEYFLKKMAELEVALVASPASGQAWDRPTVPGQFRSFAKEDSIRVVSEVNFMPLMRRRRIMTLNEKNLVLRSFCPGNANCGDRCGVVLRPPIRA